MIQKVHINMIAQLVVMQLKEWSEQLSSPQGEYPGCMDPVACNYSSVANMDDNSVI